MKHLKIIIVPLLAVCMGCSIYATDRPWSAIEAINKQVNNSIKYYDEPGFNWQMPIKINGELYGDCSTYSLVKQIELKKIGIDSHIATCMTVNGKGHAVLLVDDYVLDNNHHSIWHKSELDYEF